MFVESVRAKLDEIFSKAESKGDTFIFDNEFLDLTEMLRDHIEKQSFKLYRFSKADYDNIRNFETGTLYLSPNGAMNDIFEGIPNEDLSDLTDDDREYLKETVFLKSFSENKENQLMWAHYADFSQGMCVEYAIVPPIFPNRTITFDCATAVYCGFNMSNRIMQHLTEIAKRKSDQLGRQITVTHVELDTEKYKLKL